MGLDLVVEGCPKPGHEAEWREILARSFGDGEPIDSDASRFGEISIPPHERVGAPRVGFDPDADSWIIQARGAQTPAEVAAALKDFHGYCVLRLARSDGIPLYSHGGQYEGLDETSFRGAFLGACTDVLSSQLIEAAWEHRFPEEAVEYGRDLLAAADVAKTADVDTGVQTSGLGRMFGLGRPKRPPSEFPLEEQKRIVEAAGKWFVFWGERGHAIRAWF
ncbi:hypothetical protein ACMC5O_002161 [Sphingomonas sediminicola]|uniref:hypothetical protein n=1 Tax=Sphingomonas sediminicola TaxID=386874 RepID=UPI003CF53E35